MTRCDCHDLIEFMRFLFVILVLFVSFSASAEITILSASGFSNLDLSIQPDGSNGIPIVYGGVGGDDSSCTKDGETLCDNCAALSGSFAVCNSSRIYDSLIFEITFITDQEVDNTARAILEDADGNKVNSIDSLINAGQTHTLQTTWEAICDELRDDSSATQSCEDLDDQETLTLRIENGSGNSFDSIQIQFSVVDPDTGNTGAVDEMDDCDDASDDSAGGVCRFTAFPGDEKIFLDSVRDNGAFPNEDSVQIQAVRVFLIDETSAGTNGFNALNDPNVGLQPEDLAVTINPDGSTDVDQTVDGLTNGELYYFRVGVVDLAGNLSRVTSNAAITSANSGCGGDVTNPNDGCIYIAKPDEVLGLLSEDFNCFIATVAYGSKLDKRLSILRSFRGDVLSKFELGRRFTRWYYKQGPYAAKWIHDRPFLKPVVRVLLWPAVGFAWMANQWGIWAAFVISLIGVRVLVSLIQRAREAYAQQTS